VTNTQGIHGCPSVRCDNEAGVELAIQHLLDLGHSRIGMLYGKPELEDSRERIHAFRAAAAAGRFACREEWIEDGDFTPSGGYIAAKNILELPERPTAVFCCNDEMAIGLMRAAFELGLSIPNDVSVVGCDNSPWAERVHPAITTVEQPLQAIGKSAAMALHHRIHGLTVSDAVFTPRLIVRESSGHPAWLD